MAKRRWTISVLCMSLVATSVFAEPVPDEFGVKREAVFEFSQKPVVTRKGDEVTIAFESKGFCDATVAIEGVGGKIIRHLASGVLGPNAPAPFRKNAKRQIITWDGKDDQGVYVDNKAQCNVRVSLGLRPQFERTLFWDPRKRVTAWGQKACLLMHAAPEGVYVYDHGNFDHLRLFDHEGNYVRTVYPFPANKIEEVQALRMHTFPQDGEEWPLKTGFYQCSLLNGPELPLRTSRGNNGLAATALVVLDGRIGLTGKHLCRLASDGSSGGMPLYGPAVFRHIQPIGTGNASRVKEYDVTPASAALSPDGKTLYMTGYAWRVPWSFDSLHAVTRMPFDGYGELEVFKGTFEYNGRDIGAGTDNAHFNVPTSVACDSKGRVYVSDYLNDRVQVFSPDGKYLKTLKMEKPAKVVIHRKTDEIFVFTWGIATRTWRPKKSPLKAVLRHFGPFDKPDRIAEYSLPLPDFRGMQPWWVLAPRDYDAEIDAWATPLTVWFYPGRTTKHLSWDDIGVRILEAREGKLVEKRDFGKEVVRSVVRAKPPILDRQRLYVNPVTHALWVGESDAGVGKSFKQAVRIDPGTGKIRLVELPFDCEDMCFDINGLAYLRTGTVVTRYDPRTWREVPWDYGESRGAVGFSSSGDGRRAKLVSALATPGHRSHSFWHLGGLAVSAKGHLVVPTCNGANPGVRAASDKNKQGFEYKGKPYTPTLYPGRYRWGEIHVFDRAGKAIVTDAFPGIGHMNGIGIDEHDNVYVMASAYRLFDGKRYDPGLSDDLSETLIKVRPGRAKLLGKSRRIPVPLSEQAYPERPPDIHGGQAAGGTAWVDGAEWFYGGIGFAGKNAPWAGGGCCCWNARFCLDYFARSFAPETRHFSVAVLDSSGNLILRVGRYGNVDDGKPLVAAGGPPRTRSIGGDEVALFHGAYLGVDTDRRLFIADAGNTRILSVKLGYHAEERVTLKDAPETRE